MGEIMIKITNLCKNFGDQQIFKDFNLSINEGEKVAIIGKSGCGKSTLINIVAGLDSDYVGEIIVADYMNPKLGKTNIMFYKNIISLVLQDYGLIAEKNIVDNFKIISDKSNDKDMQQVIKRVDLNKPLNTPVYTLSGGEKQRIAIAGHILKDSDIWLCDEPTGNLDDETSEKVIDILLSLNKTMLIVTHDIDFALRCDRVIELRNT